MRQTLTAVARCGLWTLLLGVLLAGGCLSVKTEHEVKPIHITLDVNLKVERELSQFFDEIDAPAATAGEKEAP